MISKERVAEVFGITPGPWRVGRYGGVYPDYKTKHGGPRIVSSMTNSGNLPNSETNEKLCSASPEMLVALINEVISLDCEDILKQIGIYDQDISEEEKIMIKAIEAADSQKRPWPELKKALEE